MTANTPQSDAPIDAALLAALVRRAAEAAPGEICGVLGARDGRVVHAIEVPNRASQSGRFEADPLALVRAERELHRRGLRLVGYYHSHPAGDPTPSGADQAGELWPGIGPRLRLIVCPDGRWALYEVEATGWRLRAGPDGGPSWPTCLRSIHPASACRSPSGPAAE